MFINVFNWIIYVAKIANKNNKQYINLKMFFLDTTAEKMNRFYQILILKSIPVKPSELSVVQAVQNHPLFNSFPVFTILLRVRCL